MVTIYQFTNKLGCLLKKLIWTDYLYKEMRNKVKVEIKVTPLTTTAYLIVFREIGTRAI